MSDCTVCDNAALLQDATCSEKAFRWNLLKTLCYLIQLKVDEEAAVIPASVILPQVSISAATLQATYTAYAPVTFLDTTKQLKKLRIVNGSDTDLDFSYDGGTTTAFTVIAGSSYEDEFDLTLGALTSFQMKRATGMTAGFGKVLIEGRR